MSNIVVTTSDFRSRIDFRLAEEINALGYILGNTSGYKIDPFDLQDTPKVGEGYSLLLPHPEQSSRRRLLGMLPPKQRYLRLLGTMWINNSQKEATLERWVFETFGRELSATAQAAADLLHQRFGVPIHIHLASDQIVEKWIFFRGPSY
jgi:hypothetical protein